MRVALAGVLCRDSDVLLLDEPTTYLDIHHQLELMRLLRALADCGKGIITVMHDLPMAFDFSDAIAVIHHGNIAIKATPTHVCDLCVIKEIFNVEIERSENGKFYYQNVKQ